MPESAHDEEAMEVAGRMGDAPSRGRLGNVSAVAYLSECRHDVYSAGRGKSGERLIYAGDPKTRYRRMCLLPWSWRRTRLDQAK